MAYGGIGATAASKAVRMGLNKVEVQRALTNLMTADIDYFKWKQNIEREVKATRVIRSYTGRPRRFLSVGRDSTAVPAKVVREALDYKMQTGVSDFGNLTVIELDTKYPHLKFVWQMHDAQHWGIPRIQCTPELLYGVKGIVEREILIEGRTKRFPGDFDIVVPPGEPTIEWPKE